MSTDHRPPPRESRSGPGDRPAPGTGLAVADPGGDGPVLIWGHGLTSSMAAEDAWPLLRWSEVPGWRVVRYDARGHGTSPPGAGADDHTWDRLALDMLGVADRVGVDRFVAGGASMGAATALGAALAAPERVRALVLVIPPTAWDLRSDQAELYRTMADVVGRSGVEGLAGLLERAPSPPLFAADPDHRSRVRERILAADPVGLRAALEGAARSDLPDPERLATIGVPTLILAWEGDPGHPVATARRLAGILPAAELVVAADLQEVAHWTGHLRRFLSALPGR